MIFERSVIRRAYLMTWRLASVAVTVNCQRGSPKRRASSRETITASSVGSIAVIPRLSCALIASTVAEGE